MKKINQHPILGLISCLALIFLVTGPKIIINAQVEGFIPGLEIRDGKVLEKYTSINTRGFGPACMVNLEVGNEPGNVRVECDVWNDLDKGSFIKVHKNFLDLWEATDFGRAGLPIDLVLMLLEVFGVFHFAKIILSRREENRKMMSGG